MPYNAVMEATTNLSPLQRDILSRLAAHGCPTGNVRALRAVDVKTASNSACFSRAVRRLARRGLVIPIVYRRARKGERAKALVLTDQGRSLVCPKP